MATRLPTPVYAAIGRILTNPLVHRVHRGLYRRTGGRGLIGRALGVRMVLLTTTGRRTGRPRTAPLAAIPDGDRWVVVPTNGGRRSAPSWLGNVEADPRAVLEVGRETREVRARVVSPEEADQLWPSVIGAYQGFGLYRERARNGARTVPLVLLEQAPGEAG